MVCCSAFEYPLSTSIEQYMKNSCTLWFIVDPLMSHVQRHSRTVSMCIIFVLNYVVYMLIEVR